LKYAEEIANKFEKNAYIDLKDLTSNISSPKSGKAKDYESEIEIFKNVETSLIQANTEQFRKLFLDRYEQISKILRKKSGLRDFISIKKALSSDTQKEVKIIGIVREVKNTSSGHKKFVLEDPTGTVEVYILKTADTKLIRMKDTILQDEVIGVVGGLGQGREAGPLFAREVIRPSFPKQSNVKVLDVPLSAVFISDIHLGSTTFLEKPWKKFLKWLKSEEAESVKYIIIGGDLVDGIGIYPNQEEELEINDIYKQYEKLAEYFEDIPEWIHTIAIPGNHDAVRLMEPQPPLPKDIQKMFSGVQFLSNPSYFSLHGLDVLAYHGVGINDYVEMLPGMNYETLDRVMIEMLERRLLVPSYGAKVSLAPLSIDHSVINNIPDVLMTGHIHSFTIGAKNAVRYINASTWQSQTKYQKMLNFQPNPCIIGIINLSSPQWGYKKFI